MLDGYVIVGLGLVVVNFFYFMYFIFVMLFNIVIFNGYNVLMGVKVCFGCWDSYFMMCCQVMMFNELYCNFLLNDLGVVVGFLFDIGSGCYLLFVENLLGVWLAW